jgi:twitching motility two-component system response regulator PilG
MADSGPTGARVMVIDDSDTIRYSARIFLAQGGYQVIEARNGFEALAAIDREQPDLVFLDIMMPRLDGYQTCALIKRNPRYAQTPIVMLSSKDNAFDRARGRLAGAQGHLSKPFTKAELLDAAAQQLSPWRHGFGPFPAPELRAAA